MLDRNLNFENKFHFTSLGCARNLVDSEVMIAFLLKAGYEATAIAEEADFLVVNTCGFLESARQEGLETIAHLFQTKKASGKVIVTGCMVRKHLSLLQDHFPQVHYYLGSGDVEKILEAVQSRVEGQAISSSAKSYLEWGEVPRTLSTPQHFAYLKIAEGCKKRCAFCIIPAIKGPLKSKSEAQVVKEFRALRAQGVFEVILIAQDLGDFGRDRGERGLTSLLKQLLQEKGDFWIRLLYLYPDEIDQELVAIIKSDPRICPYLDMPIQHVNDAILKAMHRTTSRQAIVETIALLRREIPEIQIRTSLMVGFPGETEQQFQELVRFLEEVPLDHVGVFSFSLEKEAYAAHLPNQVAEDVKQVRLHTLMNHQQKLVETRSRAMIGKKITAIVEGYHPDSKLLLRARHQGQCPDIDGMIILNDWRKVDAFGLLYEVEITDVAGVDLVGRVLQSVKGNGLVLFGS